MQYEDLLDEAARMGVRVEERPMAPGKCGYYYDPGRLIIIDENMPAYMQRCTLVHELVHARHHDRGGHGDAKAEHRARRETALRCVKPVEYQAAERIYEGNSYLIAQYLDLPVQVVDDYKAILHGE